MSKAPMLIGSVGLLAVVGIAASPLGQGDTVRSEADLVALAGAPDTYDEVEGEVELTLAPDTTVVELEVEGLEPDTDYPAHLHVGDCDETLAGHYMDDPTGATEPPNELWPAFTTDEDGEAEVEVRATWRADASRGLSVVVHHHTAGADGKKAKVLCADV